MKALHADGWREIEDDGFIDHVGPFFHRKVGDAHQYAVAAQTKHRNLRGVVQGGMLMTFADRTMGSQFIDTAKIGELLLSQPRVVRGTKSVVFMSTEVKAGERCIILASAVFKIVRPRA